MIIYYTDKFTGGREESHKLLKRALAVYTGDESRAEMLTGTMKIGEHGKPYIEGFSCFSISHTGSIWAVLIADSECGLDIQLSRKCNYESISRRFFAPDDAALIASLSDEAGGTVEDGASKKDPSAKIKDTFFHIWTRREALTKALGGTVYDPGLPAVANELFGDDDLGDKHLDDKYLGNERLDKKDIDNKEYGNERFGDKGLDDKCLNKTSVYIKSKRFELRNICIPDIQDLYAAICIECCESCSGSESDSSAAAGSSSYHDFEICRLGEFF